MHFIDKHTLQLDKVLNELDLFVLDFVRMLEHYTDYVLISGYVAILLGRSRATEDVDIFIRPFQKEQFLKFYRDLRDHGYWCLNGEDEEELFSYLQEGLALRFARDQQTIPNFEVKFAKKHLDELSFLDRITVQTSKGNIFISSLERQIAFKRYYLKSEKDLEDAAHLEKVFKEHLDRNLIAHYKQEIERHGKTQARKNQY